MNPKFRVVPKLSLTGRKIRERLANRSYVAGDGKFYTHDEVVTETARMSKIDIMNRAIENRHEMMDLQKKAAETADAENRSAIREQVRRELEAEQLKNTNDPLPNFYPDINIT